MVQKKTEADNKVVKTKVYLVRALRTQKACFEGGEGENFKRVEYDFKAVGWKNPVTQKKANGLYEMKNEEHVKKLSHPDNKVIEVYDTKEV